MKEFFSRRLVALLDKVTEKGTDAAFDDAEKIRDAADEMTGTEYGITPFQNCAIHGIIDGILYDGASPAGIEKALQKYNF